MKWNNETCNPLFMHDNSNNCNVLITPMPGIVGVVIMMPIQ